MNKMFYLTNPHSERTHYDFYEFFAGVYAEEQEIRDCSEDCALFRSCECSRCHCYTYCNSLCECSYANTDPDTILARLLNLHSGNYW